MVRKLYSILYILVLFELKIYNQANNKYNLIKIWLFKIFTIQQQYEPHKNKGLQKLSKQRFHNLKHINTLILNK